MTLISGENGDDSIAAGVFKYEGAAYFTIAVFLTVGALDTILWLMEATSPGPASLGDVLIYGGGLLLLIIAVVSSITQSDVVVDQHGISRRFMGLWTWKCIRWSNVRQICVRPLPFIEREGPRVVRGIYIYANVPPAFKFTPFSASFIDKFRNVDELNKLLNRYIAQYKMDVVIFDATGNKTAEARL